jgi:hypothetical protein
LDNVIEGDNGALPAHCLDHQMDDPVDNKSYITPTQLLQRSTSKAVTAFIVTQMSAASGIKTYGQSAINWCLRTAACNFSYRSMLVPGFVFKAISNQGQVKVHRT